MVALALEGRAGSHFKYAENIASDRNHHHVRF
jgi:hypothetical protein